MVGGRKRKERHATRRKIFEKMNLVATTMYMSGFMVVFSILAQQVLCAPDLLPQQYHSKEGNSRFPTSDTKKNRRNKIGQPKFLA